MDIPKRYELRKLGGYGGQASTAHYRDTWVDRNVLMKAPFPLSGYDVAAEVRSLAAVNSKHVVGIYDTIRDASGKIEAIVEEDIEGDRFGAVIASALGNPERLHLLYQLACGMGDMHSAGRVHRDLKPDNIKVRPDHLLKIFDFGISTVLADGDTTLVGKGTRGYKAPELHQKGPMTVTPFCDCYSFGVMAHQALSGGALHSAFLSRPPNPLAEGITFVGMAGITNSLAALLNRCLALAPTDRPTAVELRDALADELVRERHSAVITSEGKRFVLDYANRAVQVNHLGNSLTVEYTGTQFLVKSVTGDVYINNLPVTPGFGLAGAMVITLGHPNLKYNRQFITFDISHPEILV